MRITRILIATAITALAALALTASANAQTVEVADEASGVHCGAIALGTPHDGPRANGGAEATGGCDFAAHGELTLQGHLFGIEQTASNCVLEFTGIVDEDGEGWVQGATFSQHDPPESPECTREPCPEAGHAMEAWPVHARENGGLTLTAEFCITGDPAHTSAGENRCGITFPIDTIGHHYSFNVVDLPGEAHEGPRCELTGHGELESGLEVTHL